MNILLFILAGGFVGLNIFFEIKSWKNEKLLKLAETCKGVAFATFTLLAISMIFNLKSIF